MGRVFEMETYKQGLLLSHIKDISAQGITKE